MSAYIVELSNNEFKEKDDSFFEKGVCSDITSQDFIEANQLNFNLGSAVKLINEAQLNLDEAGAIKLCMAVQHVIRELNCNYKHVEAWKKAIRLE